MVQIYNVFSWFLYYWLFYFFFFKQKTAYEMRISDWSSDVCSSDLRIARALLTVYQRSGLQALVATSGLLRRKGIGRWASLVPTRTAANHIGDWRAPRRQQSVQVFNGCVGEIADNATLDTIKALLDRCGFDVRSDRKGTRLNSSH